MGSMRERPPGSGRWELRVYGGRTNGRDTYLSRTVRGTHRDAARALSRLEVAAQDNQAPRPNQGTLAELLEDWWATRAWRSAGSRNKAREDIDRYLAPRLGHLRLVRLDERPIDALYRGLEDGSLSASGKPLGAGTVARLHKTLRAALEWGVKHGRLGRNPAAIADAPTDPPTRVRPPEPAAVRALIEAAHPAEFSVFLRLAVATGRRRGDILGLTLPQLVASERSLIFDQRLVLAGSTIAVEPLDKNQRAARVPVDAATWRHLEAHLEAMRRRADRVGTRLARGAFVFSDHPDGTAPWRPDSTSRRFRNLAKDLGVAGNLHGLRHFHITELLVAGVDVETVAQRVGDDPRTIYKTYSHYRPAVGARAAGVIGAVLEGRAAGLRAVV